MEVELVTKGWVKPSSPTPNHLRTHKLTLLDQAAPIITFHVILVFPFNQDATSNPIAKPGNVNDDDDDDENLPRIISGRTLLLKQSLSQTLTHFYPLAGTTRDKVSIDCNDQGSYYVEARVKSPLSDHLNKLGMKSVLRFLPLQLSNNDDDFVPGSPITMFQQTNFACGGIVIGSAVSHMAADGTAFSSFLKAWASTARGLDHEGSEHLYPNIEANAAIFQSHYDQVLPRELTIFNSPLSMRTRLISSRTFVFDAAAISKLKADATSPTLENPTRVEVVSAFLWRRLMAVLKASRSGVHKPSGIVHFVNLRGKASQLFSQVSPGNITLTVTSICTSDDDPELGTLASQVRRATRKIDGQIVNELAGERGLEKISEMMKEKRDELSNIDQIMFTSWCNIGHYDIDFGWGKPIKAGYPSIGNSSVRIVYPFDFLVVLMDTREGRGVEALVLLDEHSIMLVEQDHELLSFTV